MTEREWIPVYIAVPNIGIEVEVKLIGDRDIMAVRDGDGWRIRDESGTGARLFIQVTHWRRTAP